MTTVASDEKPRGPTRRIMVLGLLLGAGGLAAGYVVSRIVQDRSGASPGIEGLLWPEPKRLGAFEIDGTDGEAFNLDRLKGRWSFLFFGYTFCPDVCPTTLATMAAVSKRLRESAAGDRVQVVFVSVDPERDTLERMGSYVKYFDPTFLGATAPLERLDGLTRQLGVLHFRGEPDENGNYEVDHSASVLLLDPQARLVGIFGAPHSAEDIASQFQSMRAFLEDQT